MAVSLGDIGGQGEVGREPLDSDKVCVYAWGVHSSRSLCMISALPESLVYYTAAGG